MGPFHTRLCLLFGGLIGSVVLMLFGGIEWMMLGGILTMVCLFCILLGLPSAVNALAEIEEIRRMLKNGKELYRDGYLTEEEYRERCKKLRQEIRKI